MVAMAAIENAPLATPRNTTLAFSGQTIASAELQRPTVASADTKQPPTIQACTEPRRPPTQREPAPATSSMPISTPMWCQPDNCVVWPGEKPCTAPAKGSKIRSWAL